MTRVYVRCETLDDRMKTNALRNLSLLHHSSLQLPKLTTGTCRSHSERCLIRNQKFWDIVCIHSKVTRQTIDSRDVAIYLHLAYNAGEEAAFAPKQK